MSSGTNIDPGTTAARSLMRDWLHYLATPFPRHLRHMGYVRELQSLARRQLRCASAWRPHLEQTRTLILEAADSCTRRRAALVVGSGLLFDIPLQALCARFERVVLADIVQLWPARRQARAYPAAELVECDISGAVEHAYRSARARKLPRLSEITARSFHEQDFDLVVSANILSQLAVIPNGYLARRVASYTPAKMAAFSRHLVEGHLDWLSAFSARRCLIADLERLYCKGTRVVCREASQWGVRLPDGYREWYWELAPRPEYSFRHDVRHRVAGYVDFPAGEGLARRRPAAD